MAAVTTEQPVQQGNTAINEPWRDKVLREWVGLRIAHEGMMLEKIQKQNAVVLNSVKGIVVGGDSEATQDTLEGEGDMGVRVGDEVQNITNHYYQNNELSDRWPPTDRRGTKTDPAPPVVTQPASQPVTPEPVAVKESEKKSKLPAWLIPLLAGAGITGGGVAAYNYFGDGKPGYVDTDTDTTVIGGARIYRPPAEPKEL